MIKRVWDVRAKRSFLVMIYFCKRQVLRQLKYFGDGRVSLKYCGGSDVGVWKGGVNKVAKPANIVGRKCCGS